MSKKSPQLRFKGFTDAWEERKLSELIQKGGSGGTPKSTNKTYYDGDIPFLGISDISKSNGYIDDTEKHISEKGLNNSSAWIVPKGAISLAMYASVGKLAILNTDAATSQAFYNMVFEYESIRDYVYHRLGRANDLGEWTKLISTGTQANLNADKVKNFEIQVPQSIDEMKDISTFFNQLDIFITLQQRKLDLLKEQKKGYLQKMFPKNGEKVPELRFAGFANDWELRKLGELTKEFKSGSSIKAENIFETGTFPVYGGNGVRGYTDTFNHDGNYALIGRQGALSGNMNFSVGKAYFTEHAVAVKANEANDTRFLYFLMDKSKLGRWVTQSAQPGLAVGTLIEIKTLVPNNFEEQKKIGSFFKQLDNTIALHQRKLDLLKEQKKGFLQKMFV